MNYTLNFPVTNVGSIYTLDDVFHFFYKHAEIFGLGWHPDDLSDVLHEILGDIKESARILSLRNRSFEISEAAGVKDLYKLAFTSTRKIREPH